MSTFMTRDVLTVGTTLTESVSTGTAPTRFVSTGTAPTVIQEKQGELAPPKPYPNYKVIVLDDDFNTFQHVANSLLKYIPGMSSDRAWELTNQVHFEGQAIVWVGPFEQAELYHVQLKREGLTMAPLEKA